jgi:hypothetical protein
MASPSSPSPSLPARRFRFAFAMLACKLVVPEAPLRTPRPAATASFYYYSNHTERFNHKSATSEMLRLTLRETVDEASKCVVFLRSRGEPRAPPPEQRERAKTAM